MLFQSTWLFNMGGTNTAANGRSSRGGCWPGTKSGGGSYPRSAKESSTFVLRISTTISTITTSMASTCLGRGLRDPDVDVGALGRDRSSSSSSVFFGHHLAQARLTNHTSKFNILFFIECQNVLFQTSLLSCGCGGGVVFPMRRSLDLQASSCSLCLQCLTGSVACMLLGGVDCVVPVLDV